MQEKFQQYAALVKKMREEQVAYETKKSQTALMRMRMLEKKVDTFFDTKPPTAKQKDLFNYLAK